MMRKKVFPPGTFIPTPQRLLAIIQLCLAFSLILWYAAQPFMGEYFALKSRMLMYEYIMGTSTLLKSEEQQDKLKRNQERFLSLPSSERKLVDEGYQYLYHYSTRPLTNKLMDGLKTLLIDIPSFELAWILFSIVIAILILLKIEGARLAAYLLPCITLAYGIDNQISGRFSATSPDMALIPTESHIRQNYVDEQSFQHTSEHSQLKKGWEKYLIANWSHSQEKEYPLEDAEFNFTLARIQALTPLITGHPSFHEKSHPVLLCLYFIWNIFFAWQMHKKNLTINSINHM